MSTFTSQRATDYTHVETIAAELSALTAKLIRWSGRLVHEPAAIGDAINAMETAQSRLCDALAQIGEPRE